MNAEVNKEPILGARIPAELKRQVLAKLAAKGIKINVWLTDVCLKFVKTK